MQKKGKKNAKTQKRNNLKPTAKRLGKRKSVCIILMGMFVVSPQEVSRVQWVIRLNVNKITNNII